MQHQPTFENAFAELTELVDRLEDGGLTLDQSLEAFERGMALYRLCDRFLDTAEQRVTRLLDDPLPEDEL